MKLEITDYKENDDDTAVVTFHCCPDTTQALVGYGILYVLHKALEDFNPTPDDKQNEQSKETG